jgi:serine protease Do
MNRTACRFWLACLLLFFALVRVAPSYAASGLDDPIAAMVARVRSAVVKIVVVRPPDHNTPADPGAPQTAASERPMTAIGSGFVIDQNGFIATNKHVVEGGVAVFVISADGVRHKARVIGTTFHADMGLIKIDPWPGMQFVPFGDSDTLAPGQRVVAIGSPLGFADSVSSGVVSAVNRDIMESPFDDYIQTDAAINHGNSGGPLFNADGQVVGMTSVLFAPGTYSGSVGLGFAIPSNEMEFVFGRMIAHDGKVGAGMLPLRTQSVTWMLARSIGIQSLQGAMVAGLDDEGDRMMGGEIKPGDVILTFNDRPVLDPRDLAREAAKAVVGSDAALGLQRGDQSLMVHVKVQPYPEDPPPVLSHKPTKLGLSLTSVATQGVTVTGIDMMGTAADSGIQNGDVLLQVQQDPVTDPAQALRLMEAQSSLSRPFAAALLRRDGKPTWIAVAVP